MSAPEVQWVLDQLQSVVDNQPAAYPLERIDRDASEILEGNVGTRRAELQDANYVGVSLATRTTDPIGTEYDHEVDTTVAVRIEGYSGDFGNIDPDGVDGVAFAGAGGLVEQVRDAILVKRTVPDAGRSDVSFTHLALQNETSQSSNHAEYWRYDFDVVFRGFEDLSAVAAGALSDYGSGTYNDGVYS